MASLRTADSQAASVCRRSVVAPEACRPAVEAAEPATTAPPAEAPAEHRRRPLPQCPKPRPKPRRLEAAAALGEGREIPFEDGAGIGVSSPKYRAFERAIGRKPFIDDLRFVGMVHGALRFSDHPCARVLSIDGSKAGKAPGVIRIFTAKDIPGKRNVGPIVQDWPVMIKVGETTRYIGDVLAGVVAETEDQAREAAKLIHVEYEVLEPLTDMTKAETNPVKIHADGNLLFAQTIRRGEPVEKVLAGSAHPARPASQRA